ncbi:Spo12 domain containing protein [Trichuris trichiura]|uniref:Spo12 domain containing protein n=1 Tax=Trichuris trichiura TaxID=36087 RepID=A0A077ZH14_TRITR|nr:Spo12 domain containing protein [Trichuris trichiura]
MSEETKDLAAPVAPERVEKEQNEEDGTTTPPDKTGNSNGSNKTPAMVRVKRYQMLFSSPSDEIMSPCTRTLRQHGHFVPPQHKRPEAPAKPDKEAGKKAENI